MQMLEIWARAALGFLVVTRVDFAEARSTSSSWSGPRSRRDRSAIRGVLWWQGDLAEAYVTLGRRSDAVRVHQYLAAETRAMVRGRGAGVEARVRGLIAEDERVAGAAFRDSAQRFDDLGAPFEAARFALARRRVSR